MLTAKRWAGKRIKKRSFHDISLEIRRDGKNAWSWSGKTETTRIFAGVSRYVDRATIVIVGTRGCFPGQVALIAAYSPKIVEISPKQEFLQNFPRFIFFIFAVMARTTAPYRKTVRKLLMFFTIHVSLCFLVHKEVTKQSWGDQIMVIVILMWWAGPVITPVEVIIQRLFILCYFHISLMRFHFHFRF